MTSESMKKSIQTGEEIMLEKNNEKSSFLMPFGIHLGVFWDYFFVSVGTHFPSLNGWRAFGASWIDFQRILDDFFMHLEQFGRLLGVLFGVSWHSFSFLE